MIMKNMKYENMTQKPNANDKKFLDSTGKTL